MRDEKEDEDKADVKRKRGTRLGTRLKVSTINKHRLEPFCKTGGSFPFSVLCFRK